MLTKNLKLMRRLFYTIVVIFLAFTACQKPIEEPRRFTQGMVVSARAEASAIGLSILKKGGNAFDAMIATDLALAVSYPNAGNIGGGGFMVYRLADGQVGSLDYREKAPAQSSSNMYLDSLGNVVPNKSTEGGLAVGVPGTVAGLFEIHEKFGSLPMRDLIQPAIDLAIMGVVVTPKQFQRLNTYKDKIIELNATDCFYNQSFAAGDTLQYHTLANTLQAIQSKGKNAFYQGTIAQEMVNYVSKKGGILSLDDLKNYKAVWRDPIRIQYKDLSIISMGPPSSGGIVLGQILKMIEPFALTQNDFLSPSSIQPIVEASRRSYADRSEYLGDPDFVAIPVESLLDSEYLKQRMISFDWSQATASSSVASGKLTLQESPETTHYSIIDSKGNAVAVTTTLNANYGSKLLVPSLGFFLNNEMDDFSSKPGVPNLYGVIGGEANAIVPEKRMLSSMTPTIVEQNGQLSMILGSPGGSTIITSVLQTILNVYDFKKNIQAAVEAPRFHHQWLPDSIKYEAATFDVKTKNNLENKGFYFHQNPTIIGRVDAIKIHKDGSFSGGADPRGDDSVSGF